MPALNELKGKYITTGILIDFKTTRTGFIYYKQSKKLLDIKQNVQKKDNIIPLQTKEQSKLLEIENKETIEKNKLLLEFELLTDKKKEKFKQLAIERSKEKFKRFSNNAMSQEIALLEILRENL